MPGVCADVSRFFFSQNRRFFFLTTSHSLPFFSPNHHSPPLVQKGQEGLIKAGFVVLLTADSKMGCDSVYVSSECDDIPLCMREAKRRRCAECCLLVDTQAARAELHEVKTAAELETFKRRLALLDRTFSCLSLEDFVIIRRHMLDYILQSACMPSDCFERIMRAVFRTVSTRDRLRTEILARDVALSEARWSPSLVECD
mgnify:CR=1 FL=1